MTFREPVLTPSKRQSQQQPYTDASQATNLELFKNAIPNNNSVWLVPNKQVPSVNGRDYLQNMGMYPNPIPVNNVAVLVLRPAFDISNVPGQYSAGLSLLNPPAAIPFTNAVLLFKPVTDVPSLLGQVSSGLALNTPVVPSPFFTQDFAKPFVPTPAKQDQQAYNLSLLTFVPSATYTLLRDVYLSDTFTPVLSKTDQFDNNLSLTTFVPPAGSPFIPVDFQKPWVTPYSTQEQTLLLFFPPAPFVPLDTSSSRFSATRADPVYPNIVLLQPQGPVQSPFFPNDFATSHVLPDWLPPTQYLNLVLSNPIPFNQLDWSKGFDIPSVPTTQYPNIILLAPVPSPFYTQDFSKTQFLPSVPSPQMGTNVNLFTNPLPFNKSDWTYYYAVKPIVSDQNNLPNIAGRNPSQSSTALGLFGWTDWNKVKSPVILIPDQDNLPNLVLIINPPTPIVVTPQGGGRSSKWLQDYQKAVDQQRQRQNPDVKKAAAVMSSLGGHARAASLTSKQRSTIASKAASIRWK